MGGETKKKAKIPFMKGMVKKAQGAMKLIVGNSDVYENEDPGGQLRFDPNTMMKINVTFDKEFLPKERVVKLNVRGSSFFRNLKRNIREINGILVVYPRNYERQFDVRQDEWEKQLKLELNNEYNLTLQQIQFVSEEEVCRIYQRLGITKIDNPYNLQEGELLIIAGGFANFNRHGASIATIKTNVNVESGTEGMAQKKTKKTYNAEYFNQFSEKAGAYFYIGGEWYYNIFMPELYHLDTPRYFYFRFDGNGKHLKMFSDLKIRGIDVLKNMVPHPGTELEDQEEIVYIINPDYFQDTDIKSFKLSLIFDLKEPPKVEEEPLQEEPATQSQSEPAAPKPTVSEASKPKPVEEVESKPVTTEPEKQEAELEEVEEPDHLPFLENQLILLPLPNEGTEEKKDYPFYKTVIGGEDNGVTFHASYIDKEISIEAPGEDNIYKCKLFDEMEYSIKLGSISYTISNDFLFRIDDKYLKTFFAWTLESSETGKLTLSEDFYIFGREPLNNLGYGKDTDQENTYERLIRLNPGNEDFWSIGASRDHAIIVKVPGEDKHRLYNISLSYPVYIMKASDQVKPVIQPLPIQPVTPDYTHPDGYSGNSQLESLLSRLKEAVPKEEELPDLIEQLDQFAHYKELASHELIFIGNRIYKYVIPVVMDSPLSDKVQRSILRKIEENKSILRPLNNGNH
jgi:hypothetical protein